MAASTAMARRPFLTHWAEIRTGSGVLARTIMVNGQVAGNITCWEQWDERQVGYWVGRRYWGRGVATTALALFLCQMTSRPLHAYVASRNAGSLRVLEKCGFRRVGDEGRLVNGEPGVVTLVSHILES